MYRVIHKNEPPPPWYEYVIGALIFGCMFGAVPLWLRRFGPLPEITEEN